MSRQSCKDYSADNRGRLLPKLLRCPVFMECLGWPSLLKPVQPTPHIKKADCRVRHRFLVPFDIQGHVEIHTLALLVSAGCIAWNLSGTTLPAIVIILAARNTRYLPPRSENTL
jgi:hypothetical protein